MNTFKQIDSLIISQGEVFLLKNYRHLEIFILKILYFIVCNNAFQAEART